jgi:hypothetical protein
MESVVPKERYIDCPYCRHPISSYEPVCKKCGLEVNRAGIEELGEIEERISLALNDASRLKWLGSAALWYSFLGIFYFFAIDRQAVWFNVPLWVSYAYFIVSFVKWQRKYSGLIFEAEDLEKIRADKTVAWTLIIYSAISGFGLTFLLR